MKEWSYFKKCKKEGTMWIWANTSKFYKNLSEELWIKKKFL